MKNDKQLGEGSIGKLLLTLALPTVISQVVNMLYNIVDRMYIGHMPVTGVDALTGLGLCYPIIMIVSAFSALFGAGGAPRAAIAMGRGDNDEAERILGNCTTSLISVAIILMTVLLLFGEDLLYLFGASEVTIVYASSYLSIYSIGTVFVLLALGLNMFITTQGFAKYSMMTVLIGAILNILLDPIFIYVLDMGVQGAALATTIAQAVSALWVFKFLTGKKTILRIKKENLRLNKSILLPVMALGVAPFIAQGTESVLNICFNTSLSKYGGDIAVGTMTILSSVMSLCFMPLQGITQGAQPIISYNYGAKKMDRVKATIKLQILVCFLFTVFCWCIAQFMPVPLINIFNSDPTLVETATWAMRVYTFGIFIFGIQIACQQTFVALGQAKVSLLLACLRKLILLIPLIYVLPNFFENKVFAVFLAEPIADILATMITLITFIALMKKILKQENEKEAISND